MDGSGPAEAALPALETICEPGDEIVLLSVQVPARQARKGSKPGVIVTSSVTGPAGALASSAGGPDIPTFAETYDQTLQRQEDEMRDYLEHHATGLRKRGYETKTVVLIADKPADAILEYARKEKPTVIAMVRRSHRKLGEIIFGSVASDVAKADVAPVLFIPAPVE
jgi:nucleotide-binding universal stress UspA family protein